MWTKQTIQTGFTIVELLIVIVVIGILAAITIISFNGVTSKAKVTADVSTVHNYIDGLQQILATTGSLPSYNACLGPASTYPNATGNCAMGGQDATSANSSALNAQLKTVGVTEKAMTAQAGAYLMYTYGFYGNPYSVIYTLPPNAASCGVGNVMSGSDWRPHGDKFSSQDGNGTFCAISIS
jgi:prepilin-type N-terminal cleavage/methylation domain-containing protein